MPKKSKAKLPPLDLGPETLGQRIRRLRNERGYTQAELASKIGIIRELVSDYELERIRPHYEMIIRFAFALDVSTDELLGVKPTKDNGSKPNLKLRRRIKMIESLPPAQQKVVLKNFDIFLKGIEANK